ncbi:MAG TPA: S8 family serine peptidase [Dehalococcoidia bacterium]|nr:S8 family serine peptidase [Dehalococcoidia bacterium]
MPPRIFAQASPRSIGGVSMFEVQEQIDSSTVAYFFSEEELISRAVYRLQDAGFEVLQATPTTINIAGTAATYQRAFGTTIVTEERPVIKEVGRETTATFLDSPDTELPGLIATAGTPFEDVLEGVAIEEPRYFMAPSMFAPLKSYMHLRVPGDVSLACNADRAHRSGTTGRGIKVAMCDSGWFRHPYFVGRGYRAAPVVLGPGAASPLNDESGHGTGESANIFAVAPDVDFLPVKMSFVNSIGAFNAAVGLAPHIITCSWGSSKQFGPLSAADQALAAAIASAVAAGIVVVFSAGNGHFGFPGQHPDVISAGGVFMNLDETLRASDYASGFMSPYYPNRRAPDVCGLVGMRPKAIYIMLPVQPGDAIDATPASSPGGLQGGTHPNGDETARNDGWGAFSGTSAAAPQLAGVAALIKQAAPTLTPAQVRDVMIKTARDVTTGNCNPASGGHPATVGPDLATGHGLVDAQKAVLLAKVRSLGPTMATQPAGEAAPTGQLTPFDQPRPVIRPIVGPIRPISGPIRPIVPIIPIRPIVGPIRPIEPIRPIAPIINPGPVTQAPTPAGATQPQQGEIGTQMAGAQATGGQLSSEEVAALEDMVLSSDIDLES